MDLHSLCNSVLNSISHSNTNKLINHDRKSSSHTTEILNSPDIPVLNISGKFKEYDIKEELNSGTIKTDNRFLINESKNLQLSNQTILMLNEKNECECDNLNNFCTIGDLNSKNKTDFYNLSNSSINIIHNTLNSNAEFCKIVNKESACEINETIRDDNLQINNNSNKIHFDTDGNSNFDYANAENIESNDLFHRSTENTDTDSNIENFKEKLTNKIKSNPYNSDIDQIKQTLLDTNNFSHYNFKLFLKIPNNNDDKISNQESSTDLNLNESKNKDYVIKCINLALSYKEVDTLYKNFADGKYVSIPYAPITPKAGEIFIYVLKSRFDLTYKEDGYLFIYTGHSLKNDVYKMFYKTSFPNKFNRQIYIKRINEKDIAIIHYFGDEKFLAINVVPKRIKYYKKICKPKIHNYNKIYKYRKLLSNLKKKMKFEHENLSGSLPSVVHNSKQTIQFDSDLDKSTSAKKIKLKRMVKKRQDNLYTNSYKSISMLKLKRFKRKYINKSFICYKKILLNVRRKLFKRKPENMGKSFMNYKKKNESKNKLNQFNCNKKSNFGSVSNKIVNSNVIFNQNTSNCNKDNETKELDRAINNINLQRDSHNNDIYCINQNIETSFLSKFNSNSLNSNSSTNSDLNFVVNKRFFNSIIFNGFNDSNPDKSLFLESALISLIKQIKIVENLQQNFHENNYSKMCADKELKVPYQQCAIRRELCEQDKELQMVDLLTKSNNMISYILNNNPKKKKVPTATLR